MRSTVRLPRALSLGLALSLALPAVVVGSGGRAWSKPPPAPAKKTAQELSSSDDALQKQMDWENKVLGPNTEKKIDLAKIQKLQAEETARRERQEKIDRAEKEKREREAEKAAAAQRNVHAPSTRDVPEIEEAPPPPPKPAEKHDDAFVDRLLKDKGGTKKKSAAVTNDEVDQLLNASKPDKQASKGKAGRSDSVDQILSTADKEPSIKTVAKRPTVTDEPVSAEAAAREAALKAIAAAQAKNEEERNRNKRPVVPDAAVLRARAEAQARASAPPPSSSSGGATKASWNDPFANEADDVPRSKRSKVTTSVRPPSPSDDMDTDPAPMPSNKRDSAGASMGKDPFDPGTKTPTRRAKARKSGHHHGGGKGKRPPNWKDPFA